MYQKGCESSQLPFSRFTSFIRVCTALLLPWETIALDKNERARIKFQTQVHRARNFKLRSLASLEYCNDRWKVSRLRPYLQRTEKMWHEYEKSKGISRLWQARKTFVHIFYAYNTENSKLFSEVLPLCPMFHQRTLQLFPVWGGCSRRLRHRP